MRSVIGLVVGALCVASCGNDSASRPVGDTVVEESVSLDTVPSDTEGDRDRNAQSVGFGSEGSGHAVATVGPYRFSTARIKTFRRSHVVLNGEIRVVSTRDVFVTVANTVGGGEQEIAELFIFGFEEAGDSPADSTMTGFGTDGLVRLSLSPGDGFASSPKSWTVVSRRLAVVAFAGDGSDLLVFYDLTTAEPAINYGSEGRIVVDKDTFGISGVDDVVPRRIEDDGSVGLLVADVEVDEGNGFVTDLVVAGIKGDGTLDTEIGGDGIVSWKDQLIYKDTEAWEIDLDLADPGVDRTGDAIAGVVTTTVREAEAPLPNTTFGVILSKRTTNLQSLGSPDATQNAAPVYISRYLVEPRWAETREVHLAEGGKRVNVHVGRPYSIDENDVRIVADLGVDGLTTTADALTNPFTDVDEGEMRESNFTGVIGVDSPVMVETITTGAGSARELRVCFRMSGCFESTGASRFDVTTLPANANTELRIVSVAADAAGVSATFEVSALNANDTPRGYRTVRLDSTGTGVPMIYTTPPKFHRSTLDENDDLMSFVSEPVVDGAGGVVGVASDNVTQGLSHLVVQSQGGDVQRVDLTPPLGIVSYLADRKLAAPFGADEVLVPTEVYVDNQLRTRLYKVSSANGAPRSPFGTDGYVELDAVPWDGVCTMDVSVKTTATTAARFVNSTGFAAGTNPDDFECDSQRGSLSWTSFDKSGRLLNSASGSQISLDRTTTQLKIVAVPTADGGIYLLDVVGYYEREEQLGIKVTKYDASGAIDTAFGGGRVKVTAEQLVGLNYSATGFAATVDPEGRLVLASVYQGNGEYRAEFVRLTTAGAFDVRSDEQSTTNTDSRPDGVDGSMKSSAELRRKADVAADDSEASAAREAAALEKALLENPLVNIAGAKPGLISVRAVEDRSLTVHWVKSLDLASSYVRATAVPGGRSCMVREESCVIRGLDPAVAYTVALSLKDEPVPTAAPNQRATKPVVLLKAGRVASPTTYVRPASRGTATWSVRGGCTLNTTNSRLTAPRRDATCILNVTTAKVGSTPKTARSVTIVVKK